MENSMELKEKLALLEQVGFEVRVERDKYNYPVKISIWRDHFIEYSHPFFIKDANIEVFTVKEVIGKIMTIYSDRTEGY